MRAFAETWSSPFCSTHYFYQKTAKLVVLSKEVCSRDRYGWGSFGMIHSPYYCEVNQHYAHLGAGEKLLQIFVVVMFVGTTKQEVGLGPTAPDEVESKSSGIGNAFSTIII
jgi:hypothetical protein